MHVSVNYLPWAVRSDAPVGNRTRDGFRLQVGRCTRTLYEPLKPPVSCLYPEQMAYTCSDWRFIADGNAHNSARRLLTD